MIFEFAVTMTNVKKRIKILEILEDFKLLEDFT